MAQRLQRSSQAGSAHAPTAERPAATAWRNLEPLVVAVLVAGLASALAIVWRVAV